MQPGPRANTACAFARCSVQCTIYSARLLLHVFIRLVYMSSLCLLLPQGFNQNLWRCFSRMASSADREALFAEFASAHKQVTEEIVGQLKSSVQSSADLTQILEDLVYWWGQWWQEWWVRTIVAYHLSLLLAALCFRRNLAVQLAVFATAACTVASAQHINSLGAIYWEDFSSQPYFDKNGAFISTVVSCPLIIVMMIVLVNCVSTAVLEMIALKRRQMNARAGKNATPDGKSGR